MSLSSRFGPLPAALAFAAGIAIAPALDRLGIPPGARWAIVAIALLGMRRHPLLVVAAVFAAGAAHGSQLGRGPDNIVVASDVSGALVQKMGSDPFSAQHAQQMGSDPIYADDRGIDRVVGTVEGPVMRTTRGSAARVSGVWVWADEVLLPGQRVAAVGRVKTGRGRERFELSAQSIEHLGEDDGLAARTWRWAAEVQAAGARRIDEVGGDPAARAALRGITLGDRSAVPKELDDRWRVVGIYHVLSVSGLHLAVVAGLVFALLRRLVAASPLGGRVHPARWAAPPSLLIAIAYTLITGAQLATLRALVVIALVLIAAMIDRPIRLIDALGAAALVLLAWEPGDLFDPAFQLSFAAALTLALRPARTRAGNRVVGWLVHGITTSFWIAVTTAPITAFHFQQVSAGGVIGNLVLTPIVELLALPLALAGLVLGPFGAPFIRVACALVELVDNVAGVLAHVLPIGQIAVASALAMCVLVVLSVWSAARERRSVVLWAALVIAWAAARTPPPPGALRVTFVDVGQGDAAIVELPGGEVWLVDAGGNASSRALAAAAAPGVAITRALAAAGHDRIDLAILSHPHPDHYLGLAAITLPIGELWSAAEPEPPELARGGALPSYQELVEALAARGTRLVHPPLGIAREHAGVTLEVLAPRYIAHEGAQPIEAADPVRSVNDNSLVIAIHYRGRTFLMTGDLEREGEDALVASGLARVDVVKVPHHGSPTSSSETFVAASRPALAVISCGRANAFGFPSPVVVARWRAVGAQVERTDISGSITVVVDATGGLAVE
ncbi:MAG: DNA internalization-related competence protein ComEC/Rec2 [Deltaproteobacteria bacterium]|nr:DNA internalization-related competence protein ComEC/Rec2 [Deltaproteobacteria bacterium]